MVHKLLVAVLGQSIIYEAVGKWLPFEVKQMGGRGLFPGKVILRLQRLLVDVRVLLSLAIVLLLYR